MILKWKVLQCVAERYGNNEQSFYSDLRKLQVMRKHRKSPLDLEESADRKKLRLARDPVAVERILDTVDFQDVYVFDALARLSRSVCRILKGTDAIGTGFLVGTNIILTNHHVIEKPDDANNMFAEFDFERFAPPASGIRQQSVFKLDASRFFITSSLQKNQNDPHSGLDFTLIGVVPQNENDQNISSYQPVQLDGNSGKIIKGESCIIIQHPEGQPKKVVLKNSAFFSETESRIVYETDTLPGSSGAMVVALGTCEVIALHHAGLPKTDENNQVLKKDGTIASASTPEDQIDWIGNEGIKISRIIQAVEAAALSRDMDKARKALLSKTNEVAGKMNDAGITVTVTNSTAPKETNTSMNSTPPVTNTVSNKSAAGSSTNDFMVTAMNSVDVTTRIESVLQVKYANNFRFHLAMPSSSVENKIELFRLQIKSQRAPETELKDLLAIPGILNAETDMPLALNAASGMYAGYQPQVGIESGIINDDGLGKLNEDEFVRKYKFTSKYVKDKKASEYRKWNWAATGFTKAILQAVSPREKGIRMVQFDTGYSNHPKVSGGFDLDQDYNFLDEQDRTDARDIGTSGFLKQPGHGTRTASLLIGNENTSIPGDGNVGLLSKFNYKLVPFRISESVILINRQHQLASALDEAISQGFDIITMSMGLPPTIATAKMAKKAYDKGVIWCCAAGNEVQFVIAPAVFPGSISIAASNPLDSEWPKSSRGDRVTITAPGQDVYVPIVYKDAQGNIKDGFSYGDGTSYATPHVAAAAAYWLATYQEKLNSPAYGGWKRVEAFRQALILTARIPEDFPSHGFGAGILDVEKLLATAPLPADQLKSAYTNWNENAFFATLQGYAQLAKTYWNKLHGLIFGVRRGAQESLLRETESLSQESLELERALFGTASTRFESLGATGVDTTLDRMNILNDIILSSAKTQPDGN